jgi:predicted RNA-binding Zn ribbon-like protein
MVQRAGEGRSGLGQAQRRGGGFQLIAGNLAVDLANTLDRRPSGRPQELLPTYAHLVAWSEQAGAVSRSVAARLRRQGAQRPVETRRALAAAQGAREVLHALFSAAARGEPLPRGRLASLNTALGRALARRRVVRGRRGLRWGWSPEAAADAMLPPVLHAAAELLLSTPAGSLRECASERCRWLFVDESPTRRRRWCDMAVCGNRAKVKRHHARVMGRPE